MESRAFPDTRYPTTLVVGYKKSMLLRVRKWSASGASCGGFLAGIRRCMRSIPALPSSIPGELRTVSRSRRALLCYSGFLPGSPPLPSDSTCLVAAILVHVHFGFFMNWLGKQKGEGIEFDLLLWAIAVASSFRVPERIRLTG
jgi:hypothetical protein